jgi:hypothetical protein
MNGNEKNQMKGLPEELAPAIKALKKSLHHAHSKCGRITEVFCYNQLHPGEKLAEVEEHKPAFRQLMAIVEPTIGPSYNQKIKTGTLPAVFSAMLDLYMAGVTVQAIQMFRDLVEIGREHEGQLAKPPVQWAHDLTLESVRFYENRVKMWVRAVCDHAGSNLVRALVDCDAAVLRHAIRSGTPLGTNQPRNHEALAEFVRRDVYHTGRAGH